MDLVTWVKAFVLGVVEGATEFIPVSSTGHLILAADWLGFEGDLATTFEIVIQLGAILAVLWLYRAKVFGAFARAGSDRVARRFLINLAIAFVPAAGTNEIARFRKNRRLAGSVRAEATACRSRAR